MDSAPHLGVSKVTQRPRCDGHRIASPRNLVRFHALMRFDALLRYEVLVIRLPHAVQLVFIILILVVIVWFIMDLFLRLDLVPSSTLFFVMLRVLLTLWI